MAGRRRRPREPRILARGRQTQQLLMSQSELARSFEAARQCVGSQQSGVQLLAGLLRVCGAGSGRQAIAVRATELRSQRQATHAVPLVDCEAPARLQFRRRPVQPCASARWNCS
eukprot:scaffold7944_cov131-Isochrysis_galbana.AAC.3